MPNYPDLFILRHGQTTWNVAGRYQGRMNSELTEIGIEQAKRQNTIANSLATPPKLAFSSPQKRAAETAEYALNGMLPIQHDDRLMEIAFGSWEGLTRKELESQMSTPFEEDGQWYYDSPDGESFEEISERVKSFLDDLKEPAFVVTHGVTSLVLRGIWLGLNKAELSKLPREQGCIYHLSDGMETCLR